MTTTEAVQVNAAPEQDVITETPLIETVQVDATPEVVFLTVSPLIVSYEASRA